MNDVGLLAAMYGGNIQTRLLTQNANINFGAVFENPIYMITFLEQVRAEENVYKFDLTGLKGDAD